jgi:hypothetical protein
MTPYEQAALQQTIRSLQMRLERLERQTAGLNVDLHGRRLTNLGRGVESTDAVTRGQLEAVRRESTSASGDDLTVKTLEVTERLRVLGSVFIPLLEEAGIVFAKDGGELAADEDWSYRFSNGDVRLATDKRFRWHHGVWLRCISIPGTSCVLVIGGEDDDTTTPIVRIAIGIDDSSHPAIVRHGTGLKLMQGGGSATYSEWTAAKYNAATPATYTVSNVSTDRSYDANATTTDELADVLGTLIADLRALGLVA